MRSWCFTLLILSGPAFAVAQMGAPVDPPHALSSPLNVSHQVRDRLTAGVLEDIVPWLAPEVTISLDGERGLYPRSQAVQIIREVSRRRNLARFTCVHTAEAGKTGQLLIGRYERALPAPVRLSILLTPDYGQLAVAQLDFTDE